MKTRTGLFTLHLVAAGVIALGAAACDSESGLTGPGGDDAPAAVEGRVDDSGQDGSNSSTTPPAASSSPYAVATAEAATAAVAHVRSDGSLEVLAEADLDASGRFHIGDLPPGRSDLVVVARASDGSEVGRVLVHGETRSGAVIATAPINAETSVEGRVFAHLKARGVPEEDRSSARIALLIRMSESTAAEVAGSARAIAEVAEGVRAGVEAADRAYAELGADIDAQIRAETMLRAAVEYAESRDAGATVESANRAFVEAAVEAATRAGADAEQATLATAAAVTGLQRAMAQADQSARIELVTHALELNLSSRSQLAALLSGGPSTSVAAGALADFDTEVEASTSLSAIVEAALDTEATVESELSSLVLTELSGVSATQLAEIQAQLEGVFVAADLSARLESAATVGEVVQAVAAYRQELRAAVDAYAAALPDDLTVSAALSAKLLMVTHGTPSMTGSTS